jgi:hypothetical protein
MARRRLLGDDVWARHLKAPADEREVARYFARRERTENLRRREIATSEQLKVVSVT